MAGLIKEIQDSREGLHWVYFAGDLHVDSQHVPVDCLEEVEIRNYEGFCFFAHWPVLDWGQDGEGCYIVVYAQDLFMVSELSTGLPIGEAWPTLAEAKKDLHLKLNHGTVEDAMLSERYGINREKMTPERLRENIKCRLLAGFCSPGIFP